MTQLQTLLFYLLAGLTGLSAIATLATQNIVRSATWLLFTLGGTAGIFFLLGADFVGATQLLIYVGGTLVLVIFGVMLTAQGPFITMRTSAAEWGISIFVGLALYGVLAVSTLDAARSVPPRFGDSSKAPTNYRYGPQQRLSANPNDSGYTDVLGEGFLGAGVGPAHVESRGVVRTNYLLPFEIISVHLLVVLIGAAYLARAKRRVVRAPQGGGPPAVQTNEPLTPPAPADLVSGGRHEH
jgi:NADH-quinone oxidoreductase subunit J